MRERLRNDRGIRAEAAVQAGERSVAGAFLFHHRLQEHRRSRLAAELLQHPERGDVGSDAGLHVSGAAPVHAAVAHHRLEGRRRPQLFGADRAPRRCGRSGSASGPAPRAADGCPRRCRAAASGRPPASSRAGARARCRSLRSERFVRPMPWNRPSMKSWALASWPSRLGKRTSVASSAVSSASLASTAERMSASSAGSSGSAVSGAFMGVSSAGRRAPDSSAARDYPLLPPHRTAEAQRHGGTTGKKISRGRPVYCRAPRALQVALSVLVFSSCASAPLRFNA